MSTYDDHELETAVSRWLHELADDQTPELPEDYADQIIATASKSLALIARLTSRGCGTRGHDPRAQTKRSTTSATASLGPPPPEPRPARHSPES
jgi:hypothetical protein